MNATSFGEVQRRPPRSAIRQSRLISLRSTARRDDLRRAREILTFATNIEQAGDAVDKNLLGIANELA
jgi:Na+/phosphate symporter